jgi:alkylation response protein AidB-like acyl-CoA dehydrogenase
VSEDGRDRLWTAAGLHAFLEAHRQELAHLVLNPSDSLETRIEKGGCLLLWLYEREAHGWGWPSECGGLGGSAIHRAIFYDVLTHFGFGLPESVASLEVQGSALIEFAPAIAARVLPSMLDGSEMWCQGFSEPQAGSDLASLQTRASEVGGGWLLNGQKVWTSLAHFSQWCGVLARTGAADSRHKGLTYFWMPLSSDGVHVRPLRTLTEEDDFCEIFLDDVLVPDDLVVGGIGQGWEIAMYALQFERGMWAWQRQALMHAMLDDAIAHAECPERHVEAIGDVYLSLAALRAMSRRTVERLAFGEVLGPEVSADKVLLGQTEHQVNDLIRALTPDFATSDSDRQRNVRREWFYSRAATVYGGAVDIQKNIIASRVLGLPLASQRG